HLHGVWDRPTSVIFGSDDYNRHGYAEAIQHLERALFTTKSLILIGFGAGLDDPNFGKLLSWHRKTFSESAVEHFRLARDSEVATLHATHGADNISVVSYGASHDDLPAFIADLCPDAELPRSEVGLVRDLSLEAQERMSATLVADSLIAEVLGADTDRIDDVVMPPILLPVPHADFVRAKRGAPEHKIERLDPVQESTSYDLVLVV